MLRLRCSVLGLGGLSASLQARVLKLPSKSSCRAASSRRDLAADTSLVGDPPGHPACPWLASTPGLGVSSSQAADHSWDVIQNVILRERADLIIYSSVPKRFTRAPYTRVLKYW